MRLLTLSAVIALFFCGSLNAQNWSQWRGPLGTGHAPHKDVLENWSVDSNLAWKVKLPAPGNSTPVTWDKKVFVSMASADGKQRGTYCYSLDDGELLWNHSVTREAEDKTHMTNPFCASSPTTDGSLVYSWYGSAGLVAYTLDGKIAWQKDLGVFQHIWGTASSPVVFEDLLILNCGPGLNAYWIALDKKTGDEVWKREVPDAKSESVEEFRGSWSTPIISGAGQDAIMFISMPMRLYAVNPRTGDIKWTCGGLQKLVYTSPLITSDIAVTMGGYSGPAFAVKRGGSGDVTEERRLWHHTERKQIPQRVGSGVIVGEHIYILNEPGIAWCIELKTGKTTWQQRLGDTRTWSSMSYLDGKLYVVNMKGTSFVLKPNPEQCEIIAENEVADLTRSSLVFANNSIIQRGYEYLYCFRK